MDKVVCILRHRKSGAFIMSPMGTFRGYGGYAGINPYRECVSDASDVELGETALELLALAGPTGRDWADRDSYLADTEDLATREVKSKYRLDRSWMSTSKVAERFVNGELEQRHGQKSWRLQVFRYDWQIRSLSAGKAKPVRVPHRLGGVGLGDAIRRTLSLRRGI